jgi:DNA modification methylase
LGLPSSDSGIHSGHIQGAWSRMSDKKTGASEYIRLNFHVNNLPKPQSVLVWHKIAFGCGLGDYDKSHARDFESILFYPGPDLKFETRPGSVLSCERDRSDIHPTQKPVDLLKEMMGWHDFETVLDPFMGSGTTAVAAKECGKHFFGFEANEKYYRRAIQRIAEVPSPTK